MPDQSMVGAISGVVTEPIALSANNLLHQTTSSGSENAKIEKSAKDFESILLGTWLQQAEQSFGSVPGGDDDGDADSGKEQLMGMAMEQLGTAMTAAGGIGIAKIISKQLHKADDPRVGVDVKKEPAHTK